MKTIATQNNTEHKASWLAGTFSARVLAARAVWQKAFSVENWPLVWSDTYMVRILFMNTKFEDILILRGVLRSFSCACG